MPSSTNGEESSTARPPAWIWKRDVPSAGESHSIAGSIFIEKNRSNTPVGAGAALVLSGNGVAPAGRTNIQAVSYLTGGNRTSPWTPRHSRTIQSRSKWHERRSSSGVLLNARAVQCIGPEGRRVLHGGDQM
jgi:hypothetical protein